MNKKGVWIRGSYFNTKNYFDPAGDCQKIIKSSVYKTQDNVAQGYKPTTEGNGVLYSWVNKPLAYYDIPTLNNMIFSKKLWETIHENPFIKAALDNHCFWGEDQHRDNSEVLLENVAIRVNDFYVADNNMILGSIDLMDTPKGLTIYSLAKTGAIGNSSRGFGDLIDIGNGLTRVDEDSYLAVDWDCVGFPAVPPCMSMYTVDNAPDVTQSLMDLETGLREQITSAIEEAYEKNPMNEWIAAMFNSLHLNDKQAKVFPLASSVSLKNRFPSNKAVKSSLKKYPSVKGVKKTFKKLSTINSSYIPIRSMAAVSRDSRMDFESLRTTLERLLKVDGIEFVETKDGVYVKQFGSIKIVVEPASGTFRSMGRYSIELIPTRAPNGDNTFILFKDNLEDDYYEGTSRNEFVEDCRDIIRQIFDIARDNVPIIAEDFWEEYKADSTTSDSPYWSVYHNSITEWFIDVAGYPEFKPFFE